MQDKDEKERRQSPEDGHGTASPPVPRAIPEILEAGPTLSPDEEGAEAGDGEDGDRRPTPVRMGIETGEEEADLDEENSRRFHQPETETDWIVRVSGRSASGVIPLRTVPLMELTFFQSDEPNEPLRRILHFGETLSRTPDHELITLLERSGPFREPLAAPEGPPLKSKKGGNRRPPGA